MDSNQDVCKDHMTLTEFKMWSELSLKNYLSLRKKNVEGDFETLVYRAMSAYEEGIPVDKDAEHRSRSLLKQYKEKLTVSGKTVPDPFSLEEDWLGESKDGECGLTIWPSLYYLDIEKFLRRLNASDDLLRRLECDYKEGKAYRHFKCNFVKEIFLHEISPASKVSFLKCRVTPSMRHSNAAYHVWALIRKDGEKPGGHIEHAYCTCTAGLLGCCNHVIAMLFRIEAAVSTGATKPSCTSLLAKWNVPTGSKTKLIHKPISDMVFHRYEYRNAGDGTGELIAAANQRFKDFAAYTDTQARFLKNKTAVRQMLYETLQDSLPRSCFVEMMEGKRKNKPTKKVDKLPLGIQEMAETYNINENYSVEENISLFTEQLKLNDTHIKQIASATKLQSDSDEWFKQRKGRITASNIHKISTRMDTLRNQSDSNADNLVKSLLYSKSFDNYATRHGKATEPHAKRAIVRLLKSLNHKKVSFEETGTVISHEYPYLSASPDLKVTCECCGDGLVEIKCPYTIRDKKPSPEILPQIGTEQDTYKLKVNTDHYFQIQGQLGVTGLKYCYYFVFTHHGHYIENFLFDTSFYKKLTDNVSMFWYKYLAKELLYPKLKNTADTPNTVEGTKISLPAKRTKTCKGKQRKQKSMPKPIYVCGVCKKDIVATASCFEENSIACEFCKRWFHFDCVGIKEEEDIPDENDDFICNDCNISFVIQ